MDKFLRTIADWLFIETIVKSVRGYLKGIQPFSWEVTILLSLFSWLVYLLIQESFAKRLVSIFAWIFLILGVDWSLLGKKFRIPLLEFNIQYSPWVTAALICVALYSNQFLIFSIRSALVSWPLIAALVAGFPKFLKYGMKFQLPSAAARQDLVILLLFNSLISCWFQFHFLLQDIFREYPTLLNDNFSESAFVSRVVPLDTATPNQGVRILRITEQIVRQELDNRSWIEVQQWVNRLEAELPRLSAQVIDQTFGTPPRLKESQFWIVDIQPVLDSGAIDLRLRAIWQGPGSNAMGYGLEQSCLLTEARNPIPPSLQNPQNGASYRLECQEIKRKGVRRRNENES